MFGRAWVQASLARWSHATRLLQRFFVLCIANRVLPRSLSAVQVECGVDESAIAALTRMVAADQENWSARNKLRLLRIVQNLCPTITMPLVAIHLAAVLDVDRIMFSSLGDPSKGEPPATITVFCNPSTSPIIIALDTLCGLLDEFGPSNRWSFLEFCGRDVFEDVSIRCEARRQCFQLSAGVHGVMLYLL